MTGLVKKLEQRLEAAGKYPRTLGVFVIFDGNPAVLEPQLRALAAKEPLKRVCLGIGALPKDYEVSPEADVTVVVYNPDRRNKQFVKANFAFRKGELTDKKADAVSAAVWAVLPR